MGVRKNPENVKNIIEHIGMFIPKSIGSTILDGLLNEIIIVDQIYDLKH